MIPIPLRTSLALAAGLSCLAGNAFAATATGTFNVNVSLTPKCEITASPGNLSLSYTSWQSTASTGSTNLSLRCTNGHAYSVSLDSNAVTDGTSGLAYTLKLSSSQTPGVSDSDSMSATGNGGTGQTYYVHANAAANQEGTRVGGVANNVRTVTITY